MNAPVVEWVRIVMRQYLGARLGRAIALGISSNLLFAENAGFYAISRLSPSGAKKSSAELPILQNSIKSGFFRFVRFSNAIALRVWGRALHDRYSV
jgi:hypothetical protein